MECAAWRSKQKPSYYVFSQAEVDVRAHLPDALLKFLGDLERFYSFNLSPDKALPAANASEVMEQIKTQGYYVQIPASEQQEALLT